MRFAFCSLLFLGLCLSLGCQGAGDGTKKYRVAVVPKGTSHNFWKSIHAGAEKAARELGDVEIIWQGPQTEDDAEAQISIVDTFVTRRVDAIVLAPTNKKSLVQPVKNAMKKGVPVVIIDSGLDSPDRVSYISTDNYKGGQMAAEFMAKLLGDKGNVIVLRYQIGSESTEQREQGFLDKIGEYPDIKVISDSQYAGPTQPTAMAKAETLLKEHGGKVDGWFCPCEPVTSGTARAVEGKKFGGKIKIVGFDAGVDLVRDMRNGLVHGLVLQDPIQMGYLGVKTAIAKKNGEEVEPEIRTRLVCIGPEELDKEEYKDLHSPDLSQWLDK